MVMQMVGVFYDAAREEQAESLQIGWGERGSRQLSQNDSVTEMTVSALAFLSQIREGSQRASCS